jgi:acyl carrier protein
MDRTWIRSLLTGLLNEQTIDMLCESYEEYQDVPLFQLGLESMAVMGLVLRMEAQFGKQIDYEAFDIAEVSTLSRARRFLDVD